MTNSGQPIFRVERLPNIRELYEQQQDEIIDVSPEKAVDYKVGDEVVVDLPTRTIEGKIGYVGETDVRIDPFPVSFRAFIAESKVGILIPFRFHCAVEKEIFR